ncbi:MAG TPA: hypothetical protein VM241_02440 [Candidatus Thermoplasmatota archaeon]|nr:hypothetical protein [Candidatus Thermoplasmatota archaeon]
MLPGIPVPSAPKLGFDPDRLREFFALVPKLYAAEQAKVQQQYQGLLYSVEHPLHEDTTDRIEAAFRLPRPKWETASRRQGIDALDGLRYPDTQPLAALRAVPGLDLRTLSHYLHFFHHAYPIYTEAACRGLERLGAAMPYTRQRDPDLYARYIAAIEELKERVPFWDVPETNVYLTRIVQAALEAYGS